MEDATAQKPKRKRGGGLRALAIGMPMSDKEYLAWRNKPWKNRKRSGLNKFGHGTTLKSDPSIAPKKRLHCNLCQVPITCKPNQHLGGNLHYARYESEKEKTGRTSPDVASVNDNETLYPITTAETEAAAMSTNNNNNSATTTTTSGEPTLTLATARLLATSMENEALRQNLRMVFAIYDQHGNLKLFHRMDGTSSGSVKVAQSKGYTSASLPFMTRVLGERSGQLPGNPYGSLEGYLPLGGGVPIFSPEGGVHLGGVGVSGATPEIDEEIACFGIQSIDGINFTR